MCIDWSIFNINYDKLGQFFDKFLFLRINKLILVEGTGYYENIRTWHDKMGALTLADSKNSSTEKQIFIVWL